MAIDRTGISSLDAGASDITYSGNEGPKSPEEEMQMADALLRDEYDKYVYDLLEQRPEATPMSFEEFRMMVIGEGQLGSAQPPMANRQMAAFGGSANPTYTQKRKQSLAYGGIAGLKQIGKPGGRVEPGIMKYGMLDFITEPLGKLKDKVVDDLIPNEIKENPVLSAAILGGAANQWDLIPGDMSSENWIGELLGGRDAVIGGIRPEGQKPLIDLGGIFSSNTEGINPDDKTDGLLKTIGGGIKKGIETIIPGGSPGFLSENLSNALFGPSTIGGQQVNWKTPLAIGMSMGALDKATRKDQSLPAQTGIDIPAIRTAALAGEAPARAAGLYFTPKDETRLPSNQGGRIGYSGGGMDKPEKLYNKAIKAGTFDGTFEEFLEELERQRNKFMAQGGRIGAQEGGLMDLGGMEKDYRNEGGFVPIGGQERADDVPARLSKNEFVFTADAVRSAGGGDIDKGAEIMENVMEHLEQGGQISEESQGLEGARNMFATAQRLEGVM